MRNGEADGWRGNAPPAPAKQFLQGKTRQNKTLQPWGLDQPAVSPPRALWTASGVPGLTRAVPGLPSLSEGHSLWEPAFSREGLSKLSIWLFSSLLRRRLQLESRVFLREFLRNWGWGKKAQVRSAPEGCVPRAVTFPLQGFPRALDGFAPSAPAQR